MNSREFKNFVKQSNREDRGTCRVRIQSHRWKCTHVCHQKVKITEFDWQEFKIKATVYGEEFTIGKHTQGAEVKAITYSAMQINDRPQVERPELFVIVDIWYNLRLPIVLHTHLKDILPYNFLTALQRQQGKNDGKSGITWPERGETL